MNKLMFHFSCRVLTC